MDESAYFDWVHKTMERYGGRPHWGKVNRYDAVISNVFMRTLSVLMQYVSSTTRTIFLSLHILEKYFLKQRGSTVKTVLPLCFKNCVVNVALCFLPIQM